MIDPTSLSGRTPSNSRPAGHPYTIAIANQKGGVAKTTTVVSLGGALVKLGHDVLLIDLDAQANLSLALGVDPSKTRNGVNEVLFNSASLAGISRETMIPGLDLVPSCSEMILAERFLPVRQNTEFILRDALAALPMPSPYDYVILDCPPSMGAVTTNALIAADLLIIPAQAEYFSTHALRAMMNAIRSARGRGNPALDYRILITMLDRRNRIHRDLSQGIRSTFGDGVFNTVIEIDTKLRESAVAGVPITHFITGSRSSTQYNALAQELIAHVQEKNPDPVRQI